MADDNKKTVLIVEDEAPLRKALVEEFEDAVVHDSDHHAHRA